MKLASLCNTCGMPLDEVPFGPCPEHQAYEDSLPPLDDFDDDELQDVFYEIIHENMGDR